MINHSEFIAQFRKRALTRCLSCRHDIAASRQHDPKGALRSVDHLRKMLRHDQRMLMKLRMMRLTGYYPTDI